MSPIIFNAMSLLAQIATDGIENVPKEKILEHEVALKFVNKDLANHFATLISCINNKR